MPVDYAGYVYLALRKLNKCQKHDELRLIGVVLVGVTVSCVSLPIASSNKFILDL